MISFDISRAKGYNFGNESVSEVYYGSIRIWPHDYSRDYLTIEALESGSLKWIDYSMYRYILYSLDNGNTWQQLNHGDWISSLDAGDKIMFKSDTDYYGFGNYGGFGHNSLHFNVYGNAMSLIYGDDFIGKTDFNYFGGSQLGDLFLSSNVVDASNLILPALTMRQVNSAADNNYDAMFYNCTSLIAAPELPATTLADFCYAGMFGRCTSLTKAPELRATTLAHGCYNGMFVGCTSLTKAPSLPATTLGPQCYYQMFYGCTSLNYIKCLATDISATDCTKEWVDGVSSTGTFIKNTSMQNWTIGVDGIPSGWVSKNNYEDKYFTIEAINNNTQISFLARGSISSNLTDKLKYSLDDGTTWNNFTTIIDVSHYPATDFITLNSGDRIMLKAQNLGVYTEGSGNANGAFTILTSNAGYYNVSGNIMSLVYGDNFRDKKSLSGLPSYYFANLFNPLNYQHNLVDASNLILPATTLSEYCYYRMFNLCHQLTTAPELPATTLADYCYYCMFSGCTSLTTAPILPATTLADYCYLGMFDGCSNLSHITCLATDISALLCTDSWTDGVSQSGTFVKSPNMSNWTTGINGIPSGWTVQDYGGHDYSQDYLTFEALESGTFTWIGSNNNSIYYSLDDGSTWTQLSSGSSTPSVNTNDKVLFKASGLTVGTSNGIGRFSSSGRFNAMGNIMSLQDGDNFYNSTSINNNNQFTDLFNGCTTLVDASNLILPATTLTDYCYYFMFLGCTGLTTAPELPATTLANYCYNSMFYNCTSLTTAPELPATTLKDSCYSSMFSGCTSLTTPPLTLPATTLATYCYSSMFGGCTSLTTAPSLPAITLANYCYNYMFSGCTSLTESPVLPATTLVTWCYAYMFDGCSNLSHITCLATDISASNCTSVWVRNVKTGSSCIFTKAASMQSWRNGKNGIPSGWTVQNAS